MALKRLSISVLGAVQGVGFRPFVFRLSHHLNLKGWVLNSDQGVFIEVEGPLEVLDLFVDRLQSEEKPPGASIESLVTEFLDPVGYSHFEIRPSQKGGEKKAFILPDMATCSACREEIFNPGDRRYLYPFANCTGCGPRFSIIESLPYDRPGTSMKHFPLCPDCQREYRDPLDRRFHAQPNACPRCGPHLELWDSKGGVLSKFHQALLDCAQALREGKIVALKGLGGFHIMVDSRNEEALLRLRRAKGRPTKPFALMYPSLHQIERDCEISSDERALLLSWHSPLVLLKRKTSSVAPFVAPSVAPSNPYLGVMVPYTPLHHLLMGELNFPLVATSGNFSEEPLCIDEYEALCRLGKIADLFLVHNRPIVRPVDDSVVQVVRGKVQILRRSRGYAPLPLSLPFEIPPLVAVGAQLKSTIAFGRGTSIFISQHIGEIDNPPGYRNFCSTLADFERLYEIKPLAMACDSHPDYTSTAYGRGRDIPLIPVQHHYAHGLSCMAEHGLSPPCLAVVWDGTGYGEDGTIWGGEFLLMEKRSFKRLGHFLPFPLIGGEKAVPEPRRIALALLWKIFGKDAGWVREFLPGVFTREEIKIFFKMAEKKINSPLTSSVGRLFDGVASLLGLHQKVTFEGEAAMALQFLIEEKVHKGYFFRFLRESACFEVGFEPMILGIMKDLQNGVSPGKISGRFHQALVDIILKVAREVGEEKVLLTGGCFQNRDLLYWTVESLQKENFKAYWNQQVPPGDGGIALGQILAAALEMQKGGEDVSGCTR